MTNPRPFMKWVGGKTQLLPTLLNLFPKKFGDYYEPFIGGGAVFFALSCSPDHTFERATLNDWNAELVNAYRMVQSRSHSMTMALDAWRSAYLEEPEAYYYRLRSKNPAEMDDIDRAARTIFLNKTGFNGLYRVNKAGRFNVPFGKHKNPTLYDLDNIVACTKALKDVKLSTGDFALPALGSQPGDLVYFDPPYVPLNPTSNFTSYTSDGFTLEDQKRLAMCFRTLANRGVHAFLSNSDTPIIRELYQDFEIVTVSARRSVNSKGTGRGAVNEVVVTSKASAA